LFSEISVGLFYPRIILGVRIRSLASQFRAQNEYSSAVVLAQAVEVLHEFLFLANPPDRFRPRWHLTLEIRNRYAQQRSQRMLTWAVRPIDASLVPGDDSDVTAQTPG